jgi:ornithine carbamoyltransferase
MARIFAHQTVLELAAFGTVPVINGLTDLEHPCQVLADLQTIREKFGQLEGLKFTYIGDGNNMAHSIVQGTGRMGMDCTIITPPDPRYQCRSEIVDPARLDHEKQGTHLVLTDDLRAVQGSHVVYTDTWASMGQEAEKAERQEAFGAYTVSSSVMEAAGKNAIFMHCLPAYRGCEVSAEVIDGPASVIYDQAENRMWSQMAVLLQLMGEA